MLMKMPVAKKNVIALDIGEKRIGVALADTETRLPRPLKTLEVSEQTVGQVNDILGQYDIEQVVVGYPRNQEGEPTKQTAQVEAFVQQLKLPENIQIAWQDESLTSVQAEAELESRGGSYSKADVDALAATYILQDYLQEHA